MARRVQRVAPVEDHHSAPRRTADGLGGLLEFGLSLVYDRFCTSDFSGGGADPQQIRPQVNKPDGGQHHQIGGGRDVTPGDVAVHRADVADVLTQDDIGSQAVELCPVGAV